MGACGKRRNPLRTSGTVYVEQAITHTGDASVIWVENASDIMVGFMFPLVVAPTREEALMHAARVVREKGMKSVPLLAAPSRDAEEGPTWEGMLSEAASSVTRETARWEVLSYEEVFERFGRWPDTSGMFIDEGGLLGRNWEQFGCDGDIESEEAHQAHAREKRTAGLAAVLACMLLAVLLALTYALAAAFGTDGAEVAAGMLSIWTTVLVIAGAWMLLQFGRDATQRIYRALMAKKG